MKSTGEDVRRNPVPSLLRSLMTEHLDPGYEATAFETPTRAHKEQTLEDGAVAGPRRTVDRVHRDGLGCSGDEAGDRHRGGSKRVGGEGA